VPAASQVFSQLIFSMKTGLGQVFFPFDDDVAIGNVRITRLGYTGAGYVEDGLLATLR
jgi:hypothetical protein